jgi:hypothetical protein
MISKSEVLKCFTNFRISSHKLEIETGRYRNVPAADRKCKLCASDSVEDEIHFIFDCSTYNLYRQVFISRISKEKKNFSSLSYKNKFIWLMSNESSDIIDSFAELHQKIQCCLRMFLKVENDIIMQISSNI